MLSLGGTEASGFVKFLINSFRGSTEYDQAKAQAMLDIPDTQNPDDAELTDLDLQHDEATPHTAGSKVKDVCPIGNAKLVFPTLETTISTTGVPKEFISDNMPTGPNKQSCYYCLYGNCEGFGSPEGLSMWAYPSEASRCGYSVQVLWNSMVDF